MNSRLDQLYFDESINQDNNLHYDSTVLMQSEVIDDVSLAEHYTSKDVLSIDAELTVDIDQDYIRYVDLLKLVPEKFQSSLPLQQILYVFGTELGSWLGDIKNLTELVDKYSVGEDYIQLLANLINYPLVIDDDITISEKRKKLDNAIDWYKMKGTYQSLQYITYLLGLTLTIWDFYTKDYTNFIREPWFAGKTNENPLGLDSSYYKTPHFGLEINLNRLYATPNLYFYLYDGTEFNNLQKYIEQTRPANTVPHYSVLLETSVFEKDKILVLPNMVQTALTDNWEYSNIYFNEGYLFDDNQNFDKSATTFINSIDNWEMGTGNKGRLPNHPTFKLENVVLSGSGITKRIHTDYIEFEFVISGITQSGLSELALYGPTGKAVVYATFPDINLITANTELRVLVKVYTKSSSVVKISGSRLGLANELWWDEKIQHEWDNVYDSSYNRLCVDRKTAMRWDTLEADWETIGAGNYEWDFPGVPGYYYWVRPVDDMGGVVTGIPLLSIAAISVYTASFAQIRTSLDGVSWTPWEIYIPTSRTFRYFQFMGVIITPLEAQGYATYKDFDDFFMVMSG